MNEFVFKDEFVSRAAWQSLMEEREKRKEPPSDQQQIEIGVRICLEKAKKSDKLIEVVGGPHDPTRYVLERPFVKSFKKTAKEIYHNLMRLDETKDPRQRKEIIDSIADKIEKNIPEDFLDGFAHIYKALLDEYGKPPEGNENDVKREVMKLIMFQFVMPAIISSEDNFRDATKASDTFKALEFGVLEFDKVFEEKQIEQKIRFLQSKQVLLSNHIIGKLDEKIKDYRPLPPLSEEEKTDIRKLIEMADGKESDLKSKRRETRNDINTIFKLIKDQDLRRRHPSEVDELEQLSIRIDNQYHPKELQDYLKKSKAIYQKLMTKDMMNKAMFDCARKGNSEGLKMTLLLGADPNERTTNYKRGFFTRLNDARKGIGKGKFWENLTTKPLRNIGEIAEISGKNKDMILKAITGGVQAHAKAQSQARAEARAKETNKQLLDEGLDELNEAIKKYEPDPENFEESIKGLEESVGNLQQLSDNAESQELEFDDDFNIIEDINSGDEIQAKQKAKVSHSDEDWEEWKEIDSLLEEVAKPISQGSKDENINDEELNRSVDKELEDLAKLGEDLEQSKTKKGPPASENRQTLLHVAPTHDKPAKPDTVSKEKKKAEKKAPPIGEHRNKPHKPS